MTDPMLLTPVEAAAALGIGRSKLYELMQDGILESVHIGSCRRIPADALVHPHQPAPRSRSRRSSQLTNPLGRAAT